MEFSWLCLSTGNPGPLLYTVAACWSCRVKAATVLVRSEMLVHCNIFVSLYYDAAVARLMRSSCVPSISFVLFAPWYLPAQVEDFCSSCTSAALPGSAPGSSPRFSRHVSCCPTCHSHRRIGPCCTQACKLCRQYLCQRSPALHRSQTLDLLVPLHQILERSVCVPRL